MTVPAPPQPRLNSPFPVALSTPRLNPNENNAERGRLDSLTGLRFFASAGIVYLHIQNSYGLRPISFPVGYGVTLFFVLSGFILAHVYPILSDWKAVYRFYVARFARIWPLHFTCFSITIVLSTTNSSYTAPSFVTLAATNLLLLHAWIPTISFAWAFNAVSWTISVEAFFYGVFPLLLLNFKRNWHWKMMVAFGLVLLITGITSTLGITIASPNAQTSADSPTILNLVAINPLSRMLEFVTGMLCWIVWQNNNVLFQRSFIVVSTIEIGSVLLACWMGYNVGDIAYVGGLLFGQVFFLWLVLGGAMIPAMAIIIVVFASGRGLLGKIVGSPPVVFLGEISFAIYMTHLIVKNFFDARFNGLVALPTAFAVGVYLTATLTASVTVFYCVERPCRNWITGRRHLVG